MADELNVRNFFLRAGISDAHALKSLGFMFGKECDSSLLNSALNRAHHVCLRDRDKLVQDLMASINPLPDMPETNAGIKALAGLRQFNTIPTLATARSYCAEYWDEIEDAPIVLRDLGEEVPEWFFPALAIVARRINVEGVYGSEAVKEFQVIIGALFLEWGYWPDLIAPEAVSLLSDCYLALKRQDTGPWILPSPW